MSVITLRMSCRREPKGTIHLTCPKPVSTTGFQKSAQDEGGSFPRTFPCWEWNCARFSEPGSRVFALQWSPWHMCRRQVWIHHYVSAAITGKSFTGRIQPEPLWRYLFMVLLPPAEQGRGLCEPWSISTNHVNSWRPFWECSRTLDMVPAIIYACDVPVSQWLKRLPNFHRDLQFSCLPHARTRESVVFWCPFPLGNTFVMSCQAGNNYLGQVNI